MVFIDIIYLLCRTEYYLPNSLPVRHPDVLHLASMVQEMSALGGGLVKPIEYAAFVRPDLLQIADRGGLHRRAPFLRAEVPDRIQIIVLGQGLGQLRLVAADDVHDTAGQVRGIKELVDIGSD